MPVHRKSIRERVRNMKKELEERQKFCFYFRVCLGNLSLPASVLTVEPYLSHTHLAVSTMVLQYQVRH